MPANIYMFFVQSARSCDPVMTQNHSNSAAFADVITVTSRSRGFTCCPRSRFWGLKTKTAVGPSWWRLQPGGGRVVAPPPLPPAPPTRRTLLSVGLQDISSLQQTHEPKAGCGFTLHTKSGTTRSWMAYMENVIVGQIDD